MFAALALSAFMSGDRLEVVGYLPDYRIDAVHGRSLRGVDEVIYFGLTPSADGLLPGSPVPKEHLTKLAKIRDESGARLSVCVGGWDTSAEFNVACATPASRQRLLAPLKPLLGGRPFSGLVFDWEHPASDEEQRKYAALLRDAAEIVRPSGGRVSVAVASWKDIGDDAIAAADGVHLMSYDHGYPQATMAKSRADLASDFILRVPRERLYLGVPFYGRAEDWSATPVGELLANRPAFTEDRTPDGSAFNNVQTLAQKVRMADERGLAGVMIWELGQDLPGERSLLRAIINERDRLAER